VFLSIASSIGGLQSLVILIVGFIIKQSRANQMLRDAAKGSLTEHKEFDTKVSKEP
jgi:hypothetical protein